MQEEWAEHGFEDHEVLDSNDVKLGFMFVEAPMWHIKSPLSKGVRQLGGVDWLGQGHQPLSF